MNAKPNKKLLTLSALFAIAASAASVQAQTLTQLYPGSMEQVPVAISYHWNNNGTTYVIQAMPGGQQVSGYQGTTTQNVGATNFGAFDIPAATTITGSQSSVSSCNPAQGNCTYIAKASWSATQTTALNGAVSLNGIQSTTTLAANPSNAAVPYSLNMAISAVPGGDFIVILPGVYSANTQIPVPGVPILTSSGLQLLVGTITLGKITPVTDSNGNAIGTTVNGLEVDGTLVPSGSTVQWPAGEVTVNLPPSQLAINFQFTSEL